MMMMVMIVRVTLCDLACNNAWHTTCVEHLCVGTTNSMPIYLQHFPFGFVRFASLRKLRFNQIFMRTMYNNKG